MEEFARTDGTLRDRAVDRTANGAQLQFRLRSAQFNFGHLMIQPRELQLLLGDIVVGLRIVDVLKASDPLFLKTELARNTPAF